jgi:hypothetical protein
MLQRGAQIALGLLSFFSFLFNIWVRCKPVAPRQGAGAGDLDSFGFFQLGPKSGPAIWANGSRALA